MFRVLGVQASLLSSLFCCFFRCRFGLRKQRPCAPRVWVRGGCGVLVVSFVVVVSFRVFPTILWVFIFLCLLLLPSFLPSPTSLRSVYFISHSFWFTFTSVHIYFSSLHFSFTSLQFTFSSLSIYFTTVHFHFTFSSVHIHFSSVHIHFSSHSLQITFISVDFISVYFASGVRV